MRKEELRKKEAQLKKEALQKEAQLKKEAARRAQSMLSVADVVAQILP